MGKIIVTVIVTVVLSYFIIQGVRCSKAVSVSEDRLASYGAETADLSYGKMTYVDKGKGDVILSVHGIFGGFDQAFDTCKDFADDFRIIAPSRFGYLDSDICGDGSPEMQAKAYAELLKKLNIDKVYVLATSAGGSVAIRFALDFPDMTKGIILYCSAMPFTEKPEKTMKYAGPPPFLCNDFAMFLISPLFKPMMGMEPSAVNTMLPVSKRKAGIILDSSVTNLDMAVRFSEYNVESLEMPVLILHSEDDRLASFEDTQKALSRFKNCTFVHFKTGGHLMAGHGEEVKKAVMDFTGKICEKHE